VLLTACGRSAPEVLRIPVTKTVIEKVKTPDELLNECAQPNLDNLETTGDIEAALGEAIIALDSCSEDKKAIKEWQETTVGESV
jgi:hypothetical protein